MTWLKSCWHYILISFLTLLVLLGILIAFLLSPAGFKSTCKLAELVTHHQLKITNPEGALSHSISIEKLTWQSPSVDLTLNSLSMNIKMSDLIKGKVDIEMLQANQVDIHTQSTQKKKEAFSLQQFKKSLPVKSPWPAWFSIQQLKIAAVVYQADQEKPAQLQSIELKPYTQTHHTGYLLSAQTTLPFVSHWKFYLLPLAQRTNMHLVGNLGKNKLDMHGFINQQQFYVDHATYKQKKGYIDGSFRYQFKPDINLTIKSYFHNFALHDKQLNGYLSTVLSSDNKLNMQINIQSLKHDNNIFVNLEHDKSWQATWKVAIPKIQLYTNDAHGFINSSGSYHDEALSGDGHIHLNTFSLDNLDIHKLDTLWKIDGTNKHAFSSTLTVNQATYQANNLRKLSLVSTGNEKTQETTFSVMTPWNQAVTSLLKSHFNSSTHTWTGNLAKLDIQQGKRKPWQLKQAVTIHINQNNISWTPLTEANQEYYFYFAGQYAFAKNWHMKTKGQFLLKPTVLDSNSFKGIDCTFNGSIAGKSSHFNQIAFNSKATMHLITDQKNRKKQTIALDSTIGYQNAQLSIQNKILSQAKTIGSLTTKLNKFDINQLPQLSTLPVNASMDLNLSKVLYTTMLNTFAPGIKTNSTLNIHGQLHGSFIKPVLSLQLNQPGGLTIEALNKTFNHTTLAISTKKDIQANLVSYLDNTPIKLSGLIKPSNGNYDSHWTLKSNQVEIMHQLDQQFEIIPDVALACQKLRCTLSGKLSIPKGRYQIQPMYGSTTLPNDDIEYVHNNSSSNMALTLSNFTIDLGKNIYLTGYGLHSYLAGSLHLNQTPQSPLLLDGQLILHDAYFQFSSNKLNLKTAQVSYVKAPASNPNLQIQAEKTITIYALPNSKQQSGTVTVGLTVSGTLKDPIINLYSSSPALSQADILSYILFNQPASSASILSGASLVASLQSGGSQSKNPITLFKQSLGLSEFGIETENNFDMTGNISSSQSQFVAGKKLFKKVYLRYSMGLSDSQNVIMLIYQLSKHWSLQSSQSTQLAQSNTNSNPKAIDLMFQISSNSFMGWLKGLHSKT